MQNKALKSIHLGLSGASLGQKNIMAGVCIEMDKCKNR
ncbi:hypothetical protein B4120_3315 [Bacillus cereus]|nr:hypothetical protein B4120_3315 [Bacillus cereus]